MTRHFVCTALAVAMATMPMMGFASNAYARERSEKKHLEIPQCARPLGVLAVVEPETRWWEQYGLGSPEAIIKYYVSESGCFTLADRGRGMDAAARERALAAAGVLRPRANIGKGQVRAADYVLTPDLLSSNNNASGNAVGGILGTLIGGQAGAILGGLTFNNKTADVTLSLVNVRSAEADIIVRGSGKNMDIGWGAGAGVVGSTGLGAVAGGGYTNTEVGKVIMTAYLDAYIKLVNKLGGLPVNPAADAPKAAFTTTASVKMREGPSIRDPVVRSEAIGALLYPTGAEAQGWLEVEDEMQYKGWVSKLYLQPAK
jgi:curli biogenesis system outer membrane secretion channel CsgG